MSRLTIKFVKQFLHRHYIKAIECTYRHIIVIININTVMCLCVMMRDGAKGAWRPECLSFVRVSARRCCAKRVAKSFAIRYWLMQNGAWFYWVVPDGAGWRYVLLNKPRWHVVMHGIAGLRRLEWFCSGGYRWYGVIHVDSVWDNGTQLISVW